MLVHAIPEMLKFLLSIQMHSSETNKNIKKYNIIHALVFVSDLKSLNALLLWDKLKELRNYSGNCY